MTYGAELSAAWADHLAPRKSDAYTVASIFAGCGGSSLGYSMAGYRELLAVEWDAHAAHILRRNFPDVSVHQVDITKLDAAVLDLAPGELDVLDGSPPCQGFSTSGRRRTNDPRNGLFREYVRLLDAWQPQTFVMENVSGLVRDKMRPIFAEMLRSLRAAGPGYRVEARLVDASRLRVPQARNRIIFIGVRADLGVAPRHPRPAAHPLTVREAWADLREPGEYRLPTGKIATLVPRIPPGRNGSYVLKHAGRALTFWDTWRLRWDRPSNTICKTGESLIHPSENRWLGVNELARLQSFPDEFDWARSTYAEIQARIGNSVPPLMMRAIATTVRDILDDIDGRKIDG